MKSILTFILAFFFSALIIAQSPPQLFNFQAVARDAMGEPIVGVPILVTFEILEGNQNGIVQHTENATVVTEPGGLFSHSIGSINATTFQAINWGEGPWYLRITINYNGNPPQISTQQLVSVPYALYAKEAANAGVPPGTIVAFGGDSNNNPPPGWVFCDGSMVSKTEPGFENLYAAIGTNFGGNLTHFYLPDFRGRFLRGVSDGTGRDPNAATRTAMNPGGNTGDQVGSIQDGATMLPNTDFSTSSNGNHSHTGTANSAGTHSHSLVYNNNNAEPLSGDLSGNESLAGTATGNTTDFPGNTVCDDCAYDTQGLNSVTYPANTGNSSSNGAHTHTLTINAAGAHTHNVTEGGDAETRPINAYVHYIIKL